jgi:DNA-binding LacI/PurR family transcriptional regulator
MAPTQKITPPPIRRRLTLGDVAAALGVSRATVSNAFNRPDQLSAQLREQILQRSRELGYFGPDPAARALRRPSLREVAVIYHHGLSFALNDPLSMMFLQGVASELDRRGLSLQLIPKLGRDLELTSAFQTTADALIVHAEIGPELAPEVLGARKPLVLVDTHVAGVPSVRIADRSGAATAMAYALERRPDRVLALCFTLNELQRADVYGSSEPVLSASVAVERRVGFLRAATQHGWLATQIDWIEIDDLNPEGASERLRDLQAGMAAGCRVAVVAMTDRMGLSALAQVRQWPGVQIVAAVGFDDIPAAAAAGLTTIRQDARRKGELAVCTVLDRLGSTELAVELVQRDT